MSRLSMAVSAAFAELSGQSMLPSFPDVAELLGVDVGPHEYSIEAFTIKGR